MKPTSQSSMAPSKQPSSISYIQSLQFFNATSDRYIGSVKAGGIYNLASSLNIGHRMGIKPEVPNLIPQTHLVQKDYPKILISIQQFI
jgi:hypothetical protein